jgi:ribosomal protein S3AE
MCVCGGGGVGVSTTETQVEVFSVVMLHSVMIGYMNLQHCENLKSRITEITLYQMRGFKTMNNKKLQYHIFQE